MRLAEFEDASVLEVKQSERDNRVVKHFHVYVPL